MRQKHIGALVVTENTPSGSCAIGVVTDRDMMLDTVAVDVSSSQTCAVNVMGQGVLNVPPDASLSDTLQGVLSSSVRRVGVTSGGVLIGVLSLDDTLSAMATELGLIARPVCNEYKRGTIGNVQLPLSV